MSSILSGMNNVSEGGMPQSVIRSKERLAAMTPEQLKAHFEQIAMAQNKQIQDVATAAAWRHGFGKGSLAYWNKIKDIVEKPMSGFGPHNPKNSISKRPIKENASTENLRTAWQEAQKITKAIKYDGTVQDIIVKIQMLAQKYGIDKSPELEMAIDAVNEANNALEGAVYGLDTVIGELYDSSRMKDEDGEEELTEAGPKYLITSLDGIQKAFSYPNSPEAEMWAKSYAHKKNNPLLKKPPMARTVKPKLNTDRVWMDVMMEISKIPEQEPFDTLQPVMRKYGLEWEDLNKIAQKEGYDGVWGYFEELHKEAGTGLLGEASGSNMYPVTYAKFNKDPNDPYKINYVELYHANIDFGDEKPTNPERIKYLVDLSAKHKELISQGYKLEDYGKHIDKDTYYSHPTKIVKDTIAEAPQPVLPINNVVRPTLKRESSIMKGLQNESIDEADQIESFLSSKGFKRAGGVAMDNLTHYSKPEMFKAQNPNHPKYKFHEIFLEPDGRWDHRLDSYDGPNKLGAGTGTGLRALMSQLAKHNF